MCWIYKRAISKDGNVELDYTDGTTPFRAVVDDSGKYPKYKWEIYGDNGEKLQIDIPLNVPHEETDSIVNKGQVGNIEYEFLYGKFRSYPRYMIEKFGQCFIMMILASIITIAITRRRK